MGKEVFAFFAAFLLIFTSFSFAQSTISSASYNVSSASAIINSSAAYVNTVNQSAYLVFYPNLAKPYAYLNEAKLVYKSSPSTAVEYANLASLSAQQEYERISSYKSVSLLAALILTILFFAWTYFIMKPSNKKRRTIKG